MKIDLYSNREVKKAKINMWKHIILNWLKFKFKHSPQSSYELDNKNNLSGTITGVECNCGKIFYTTF